MSSANNNVDSTVQQTGSVDQSKPRSKYVPPHLRNRPEQPSREEQPAREFDRDERARPDQKSEQRFDSRHHDRRDDKESGRWSGPKDTGSKDEKPSTNGRWDNAPAPRRAPARERDGRVETELFGDAQSTGVNFDHYEDIPVDINGQDVPPPIESFSDVKFHEYLLDNIQLAGYTKPTPVQKNGVAVAMGRRDLMACAQTGSGKTAAFLFPIVDLLLRGDIPHGDVESTRQGRNRKVSPSALILAPTRELATQIHHEAKKFTYRTGIRSVVVYGGQDIRLQFREVERGADILVATPGRLVDFLERGRMSLSRIAYLVFDEADRMLDLGFEPQIRQIVEQCDMPDTRQTLMFSATFPKVIQRLAQDFLQDYIFLAVGKVGSTSDFITQKVEYAGGSEREKKERLLQILTKAEGLTLIFVETKKGADSLEEFLIREGIDATSIHGDRTQQEREDALSMFRCGRCPVLVATDVASRGLDIPDVRCVVNYDLPTNIDDYVHRIGRTGRCGHSGTAIAFVSEKNRPILRELFDMLKEHNQEIPNWFETLVHSVGGSMSSWGRGGSSRGGRGGSRGGSSSGGTRFATRDFRKDIAKDERQSFGSSDRPSSSASSGSRGGGSYASNGFGFSKSRGGSYGNDAW